MEDNPTGRSDKKDWEAVSGSDEAQRHFTCMSGCSENIFSFSFVVTDFFWD